MYLGSFVTVDGGALQDVKAQIKKANFIFVELYRLWENKNILMKTKAHTFNSNVKSALLCECETWDVTTQITNKLQAFVYWCLQRIMGVRWSKITSNTAATVSPTATGLTITPTGWLNLCSKDLPSIVGLSGATLQI